MISRVDTPPGEQV